MKMMMLRHFLILLIGILILCAGISSASAKTQSEIKAWLDNQDANSYVHGSGNYRGQCVPFVSDYLAEFWGISGVSASLAKDFPCPPGWSDINIQGNANNYQMGDIIVEDWGDGIGHVAVYYGVEYGQHYVVDQNSTVDGYVRMYANKHIWWDPISSVKHCYRATEEIRGEAMTQGFDRALPDGDYIIATAAGSTNKSTFCYLDIQGDAYPAASETNVVLCGPVSEDPPVYDVWTITYNSSDKFYTIRQKGTNQCLDIYGADTKQGANVQVCISNNGSAQKWAITHNGSNGYRLQPKCSGAGNNAMCLDVYSGNVSAGTNIQQWKINDTTAQSWLFIPYQPAQPVAEGRYILLYSKNPSYEIDVAGDTGDIPNNTNVQVCDDTALSQYNSFDFVKLSNGYYKIKHAASGKCLDVTYGTSALSPNVAVYDDNGSIAQQWAVVPNGTGYLLIARCNGYALDYNIDPQNIEVYPRHGGANQTWSFVRAEYSVCFDANDGENEPINQTKYYKTSLVLSNDIPTRNGFTFQGWAESPTATLPDYQPGDSYTEDKDVVLYAVWAVSETECTIFFEAYGGTGEMQPVKVQNGAAYTLPACGFTAPEGQAFDQWDKGAAGDQIIVDRDITLTARWKYNEAPAEIVTAQFSAPSVWPVNSVVEVRLNYENAARYMYHFVYPMGGSSGGTFFTQTVDGVTIGYIDVGDHGNGQKATFGISAFIDGNWTEYTEIQIIFFSYGKLPTPVISFPNQGDTINIGSPLDVEITGCDTATEYRVYWPKENSNDPYRGAYIKTPQMTIAEDYFYTPGTYRIQVVASAAGWEVSDMASKLVTVEGTRPAGPTIICNEDRIVKHSVCSFTLTKENATEFEYYFDNYQEPRSIQAENGTVTFDADTTLYTDEINFTFKARAKVNNVWSEYSTLECAVYDKPNETGLVSISFSPNGGTGDMEKVEVVSGSEYSLPACGFTAPEGKEFSHWDKGPVGAQITVNGDMTLTAQWKDRPSRIIILEASKTDLIVGESYSIHRYVEGFDYVIIHEKIDDGEWTETRGNGSGGGVAGLNASRVMTTSEWIEGYDGDEVICSDVLTIRITAPKGKLQPAVIENIPDTIVYGELFTPIIHAVENAENYLIGFETINVSDDDYEESYSECAPEDFPDGIKTWTTNSAYFKKAQYRLVVTAYALGAETSVSEKVFSIIDPPSDTHSGKCGDDLYWGFDESSNTVTIFGSGAMYDYSLENTAPWGTDFGHAAIKPGVTSIGDYAFKACNITGVTVPDSVTSIGAFSFYKCESLTAITIPSSVKSMGAYAFGNCLKLSSVTISDGVPSIGDHAFSECACLANVTIPGSVRSIGSGAFSNCVSLTNLTIPNSVISIGESAFVRCTSLTGITIPSFVTNIKSHTFSGCTSLSDIIIPQSVTDIYYGAFQDCTGLTRLHLPSSVVKIEYKSFYNCDSLTDVYFEGAAIHWKAIEIQSGNEPLMNAAIHYELNDILIMPASLSEIGEEAFAGGTFTTVQLSENTTVIQSRAFADCKSLESIVILNKDCLIADDAFSGSGNLVIYAKEGSTAVTYALNHGYGIRIIKDGFSN